MLRTAHSIHPASTPTSRPTPGASLPGTLASPRTGLTPAGCHELLVRLRHVIRRTLLLTRRPNFWTHTSLSLTVAGKVKVLNQWKPRAGPSMVARISVPLTAALPRHAGSTRFTSVYDVTFTSAGNPIGWAPADYQIGGNS